MNLASSHVHCTYYFVEYLTDNLHLLESSQVVSWSIPWCIAILTMAIGHIRATTFIQSEERLSMRVRYSRFVKTFGTSLIVGDKLAALAILCWAWSLDGHLFGFVR